MSLNVHTLDCLQLKASLMLKNMLILYILTQNISF